MIEETLKEINRICDAEEARLIQLIADIYRVDAVEDPEEDPLTLFLFNDALEIKREQYLNYDGWSTHRVTMVTSRSGGPRVEVDTDYRINAYWRGEKIESAINDPQAREAIDRISAYLNEHYGDEA